MQDTVWCGGYAGYSVVGGMQDTVWWGGYAGYSVVGWVCRIQCGGVGMQDTVWWGGYAGYSVVGGMHDTVWWVVCRIQCGGVGMQDTVWWGCTLGCGVKAVFVYCEVLQHTNTPNPGLCISVITHGPSDSSLAGIDYSCC